MGGNDHIVVITSQKLSVAAHIFTDLAFDPIPIHRAPPGLQGNPKPQVPQIIGHTKNYALTQANDLALSKKPAILPRIMEAGFVREILRMRFRNGKVEGQVKLLGSYTDRQTLAAFCAAPIQYQGTGNGFHTGKKTVSAAALGSARLQCSFHGIRPRKKAKT